ncbi:MAG: helix-turn-helix transcriptional regulator [Oscillospiraceae bacterium]|nr:helix-turn-helix transcriptional regulator [Oscillospiraceae bacterium]
MPTRFCAVLHSRTLKITGYRGGYKYDFGRTDKSIPPKAGLSQEQLAQALQVSGHDITTWEADKELPDPNHLTALNQKMGTALDGLVNGGGAIAEKAAAKRAADIKLSLINAIVFFSVALL